MHSCSAVPPPPPDHEPPRPKIADYEIVGYIASGSYGDVWLARGVTGIYRAIKVVQRARFTDPRPYEREFDGLRRFAAISLGEARQLALLHVGRDDKAGFFYYVMELADDAVTGREIDPDHYCPLTLSKLREQRGGRLPVAECVNLAVDLARALAGLHAHDLVHRDIKPSNLIFVGGVPKLADIGLVTHVSLDVSFVGAAGYMPPEGPGQPTADVYSLGKVLYELATGLDRNDYPRLPENLSTLPDYRALLEFNEILLRACEPLAAARYPNAQALLDDVLLLQAGKSVRRLRSAERRLSGALRIAVVLAVIASIAGVGAFLEHKRAQQAEGERDDLARKTVYSAGLSRAQRALETDDLGKARYLLQELIPKSGEPDLRGFEWQAMLHDAQGDAADILREKGPSMQTVRFSSDGKFIAGHSADLVVTIWNSGSKHEIRRIKGIAELAGFSNDGKSLIGIDTKRRFQRWTVDTGLPDKQPAEGENRPLGVLDQNLGVSFVDRIAGVSHAVRIWDFERHRELMRLPVGAEADGTIWDFYRPGAAAVSADGLYCALGLINGRGEAARWRLEVHDFTKKRLIFSEVTAHRLSALAFSSDGRRLAVAFGDTAEIALLDIVSLRWLWRRSCGSSQTDSICFSPDDNWLVAGGRDPVLSVLSTHDGKLAHLLRGHLAGVTDVKWMTNGNRLISAGIAGEIRWWIQSPDIAKPRAISGLWRPAGGGRRLCLSDDGEMIAASDDPSKGTFVATTKDLLERARVPGRWYPIEFKGNILCGLRDNGRMEHWQIGGTAALDSLLLTEKPITLTGAGAISSDQRILTAAGSRGELIFWNLAENKKIAETNAHRGAIWYVAMGSDGKNALTGGGDKHTKLWNIHDAKVVADWPVNSFCGSFSPDRRWIALGLADGHVEIRFTETGQIVRRIQTESAPIQSLCFSADGTRLACGGPHGTVHLFSSDDGRELVTWRTPIGEENPSDTTVSGLMFSSNGHKLAAYLNDGRIWLWNSANE